MRARVLKEPEVDAAWSSWVRDWLDVGLGLGVGRGVLVAGGRVGEVEGLGVGVGDIMPPPGLGEGDIMPPPGVGVGDIMPPPPGVGDIMPPPGVREGEGLLDPGVGCNTPLPGVGDGVRLSGLLVESEGVPGGLLGLG